MGAADQLSDQTLGAVLARIEAASIVAPASLEGDALAMFADIAGNNRSRPWNASHATALAHYCRVVIEWEKQFAGIEREGSIVDGKPNARFKACAFLASERLRLGKLLGLAIGAKDRYLSGNSRGDQRAREVGGAILNSSTGEGGSLLA
jgi:hypothetical protein